MRGLALAEGNEGSAEHNGTEDFGANAWLVDEMYKQYLADPNSVDRSWWPVLQKYASGAEGAAQPEATTPAASATPAQPPATTGPAEAAATGATTPIQPSRTTNVAPRTAPIPADAPRTAPVTGAIPVVAEDTVTPLKGMARTLSKNMDESLTMPTATSVRTVPAKLLIDNRIVINSHLRRSRGGKVSFTHLIGWAIIQALKEF
ncbi:MAG: 2-oxo acid dehydrogenase subunit E2, partial [Actinobacteria bacterium]|nr:2-oxo acid dehydrogenase subunit E2 [Actinomycetota bacterium]